MQPSECDPKAEMEGINENAITRDSLHRSLNACGCATFGKGRLLDLETLR